MPPTADDAEVIDVAGASTSRPGFDPAPVWDGREPHLRWKQARRLIVLWDKDSDLKDEKKGVRLFRQLQGSAAILAQGIEDEVLFQKEGVPKILEFFDEAYRGYLAIAEDEAFESVFYKGERKGTERMIEFCAKKQQEYVQYEKDVGQPMPDKTKGTLVMRHANLSASQKLKVHSWLKGDRSMARVIEEICNLDTDDTESTAQKGQSKEYLQQNDNYQDDTGYSEHEQEEYSEPESIKSYYVDPAYDYGEDSDCEDCFLILPQDLQEDWDEGYAHHCFANFREVRNALSEKKKARGFFAPPELSGSSMDGKGKVKGKFGKFGKSKGKFGFKGKSKNRFGKYRHQRNDRRQWQGMVQVSRSEIMKKVRCWRCGELGHMSRDCKKPAPTPQPGGGSRPNYFFTYDVDEQKIESDVMYASRSFYQMMEDTCSQRICEGTRERRPSPGKYQAGTTACPDPDPSLEERLEEPLVRSMGMGTP